MTRERQDAPSPSPLTEGYPYARRIHDNLTISGKEYQLTRKGRLTFQSARENKQLKFVFTVYNPPSSSMFGEGGYRESSTHMLSLGHSEGAWFQPYWTISLEDGEIKFQKHRDQLAEDQFLDQIYGERQLSEEFGKLYVENEERENEEYLSTIRQTEEEDTTITLSTQQFVAFMNAFTSSLATHPSFLEALELDPSERYTAIENLSWLNPRQQSRRSSKQPATITDFQELVERYTTVTSESSAWEENNASGTTQYSVNTELDRNGTPSWLLFTQETIKDGSVIRKAWKFTSGNKHEYVFTDRALIPNAEAKLFSGQTPDVRDQIALDANAEGDKATQRAVAAGEHLVSSGSKVVQEGLALLKKVASTSGF